jgi:hypothetical protein
VRTENEKTIKENKAGSYCYNWQWQQTVEKTELRKVQKRLRKRKREIPLKTRTVTDNFRLMRNKDKTFLKIRLLKIKKFCSMNRHLL